VVAAETAVRALMAAKKVPGLSIAVGVGDLRWSSGFGMADLENEVPVTPRTVFRFASISKPITAVATLQLVEQGRLNLDAPIQTYVSDFPTKQWPITARNLLCHQGGVRWYRGAEMHSTRPCRSVREGLAMFKDDPLEFEPGTRFLYTSYGFNLLGAAVERAGGLPYVKYVRQNIFDPAGMSQTRDDSQGALIPHRARGYIRMPWGELRNSVLADTSGKVPGGGLCGTAEDLVAFASALHDGTLLKAETLQRMREPQKLRKGQPTGYALGWNVERRNGVSEMFHAGHQPQVSTLLYVRPDRNVSVAILCNLEGVSLFELARTVADAAESATR
jgi:CubicO group peptidase (beta-lactamase class C family)